VKAKEDANGRVIYDAYRGIPAMEIAERDDGWIGITPGPSLYLAPFRAWPAHNRAAMKYVRGRVLDVGCGAGRVALHLQNKDHDVVAIDTSPLAIKTCRLRGVRKVHLLSVARIGRRLGEFDSVLLLGNNFGLMGNRKRARWLLRRFAAVTSARGRIIAETLNPYATSDPGHRRYHRRNRNRGRMGGQIRIRVRYCEYCSPWFDWLLVSPAELRELLLHTPWHIERILDGEGPQYIAVLGKKSEKTA
jgi:SAM-dependent methyltransferase